VPDLFIGQEDGENCGPLVFLMICAHFNRPMRLFFAGEKDTTPRKLMNKIRRVGLEAKAKDISIRSLDSKSWLILWYPPRGEKRKRGNHYVVFVTAENGKYLIYDSVKKDSEWLTESELKKVWYRKDRKRPCGWVIEIRDPGGQV